MSSTAESIKSVRNYSIILVRILKTLFVFIMALVPPVFLFFYLDARGPLWLLIAWICMVLVCEIIAVFSRLMQAGQKKRGLQLSLRVMYVFLSASAVLLVLLQMNVARRSLAEAWFNLVRSGRAFGFFSYFAAEILAVFSTQCAVLSIRKNFFSGISALAGVLFLVYALLYAAAWSALVSVLFLISALLSVSLHIDEASFSLRSFFRSLMQRIKSIFFPFAAALLLSVPFLFTPQLANKEALLRPVDLSPLVFRFAPSMPLLLDVPGYGYSVGAARFAPSVYLSDAVIFSAQALPLRTYYLATERYDAWSLSAWSEWVVEGNEVPVYRDEHSDIGKAAGDSFIRLKLEAELFDSIPLPFNAVSVQLKGIAPEIKYANSNRGLRFEEAALGGLEAVIGLTQNGSAIATTSVDDPESFLDAGPDNDGLMKELVASLGTAADPAVFVNKLGAYFLENYSYSLDTPVIAKGDPLTTFLFEHKTGYCLHFASSGVLLARRAGIPARLVEGFVLRTDHYGRGFVRGVDAHAWMEYWANGRWQLAELTPPFVADDPFRFLANGDTAAQRQLRAIFGDIVVDTEDTNGAVKNSRLLLILVLTLALLPVLLFLFLFRPRYLGDPYGSLKRRACRMVRKGRRRGIEGPEIQGWTRWAHEMEAFYTLESEKGRAEALALLMLEAAFNPDVLSERKTIKMNRC